jgi:hypothetical protein
MPVVRGSIGVYYKLYEDLMYFWQELSPGHMCRVSYENLVDNRDDEVRHLLQYCELPFHDECLSFHETKRAVSAPSSLQVRQSVYKYAVGRADNYE